MSWGARSGWMSRVSIALAALAIFVKLLVPAGYMLSPQTASNGLPSMVICTGHGELVVSVDADGKPTPPDPAKHDDGKSKSGDHPCTFASSSAADTPSAWQISSIGRVSRSAASSVGSSSFMDLPWICRNAVQASIIGAHAAGKE